MWEYFTEIVAKSTSDWQFVFEIALRTVLSVVIGGIIGSERARHGRAAGMRTHILVCLGAALTSMTGVFLADYMNYTGDITRISAQVVSGIGFLGVGMIIIKNNNIVSGLTTAAGIWATSIVGIALGCGFYVGAIIVAICMFISIVLLSKLERYKKRTQLIYIEIDDMYKINAVIKAIEEMVGNDCTHKILPSKSGLTKNIGLTILIEKKLQFDILKFLEIENVVFVDDTE